MTACLIPEVGRTARLSLALSGLIVACMQAEAAGFAVNGSFTIQHTRDMRGRPTKVEGPFSIKCRDCQWLIRSRRSDQTTDYEEDGCDGTNVYSLTWFASSSRGFNSGAARITAGIVPFNSPPLNRILWLIYASSCYLSNAPANRLPALMSSSDRHAYLFYPEQPAEWRSTGTAMPLPVVAILYDDGYFRYWPDDSFGFMTGPPNAQKWRPPYDQGFTNAVLSVESFFEHEGGRIAREATFRCFLRKRDGTSPRDLALGTTYTFFGSNISSDIQLTDFRPEVKGVVLVTDKRFEKHKNPTYDVPYRMGNSRPSIEEVRQSPDFLKQQKAQLINIRVARAVAAAPQQAAPVSPLKRAVVLSVLSVVTLLGLVLILTKTLRKTNPR